ncbi:MAG: peroxidase family protein, partial [Verrucomicrobiales bacterium]
MNRPTFTLSLFLPTLLAGITSADTPRRHPAPEIPLPRTRPAPADIDPTDDLDANADSLSEFRTITGYGNNLSHPEWGVPKRPFLRLFDAAYADGSGEPAGESRP